ncbi:MAG: DUF484 domain-containing protein [Aquificaceae bacterium]|nr:MAG: DUF484 domain-containing protein [Aquificaceae bacterium]
MSSQLNTQTDNMLDEDDIASYLYQHPDFFQRHTELLETQYIPHHNTGTTTSLIERQVGVLRDKNNHLEEQLNGLLRAARSNEQIVVRLQHLTLKLLRSEDLDEIITICQDVLRSDFNADFVSIRLIKKNARKKSQANIHFIKSDDEILTQFESLFKNKKPKCGKLSSEQQKFLFAERTDDVKSVALLPLQSSNNLGILALGSKDEARFHPGMGTVFIAHLAELISAAITRYVK